MSYPACMRSKIGDGRSIQVTYIVCRQALFNLEPGTMLHETRLEADRLVRFHFPRWGDLPRLGWIILRGRIQVPISDITIPNAGLRLPLSVQGLEFFAERLSIDAQDLGGLSLVAVHGG